MSSKTDDISGRNPLNPQTTQGRYDLPGGAYEIIETDLTGSIAPPPTQATAVARRVITTYRPAYLSEDETVLACCHHAHELAKANGAREVMLEHLVHALARVPDAAQVLADRGINVEGLKRESAAVISSEIPVDHTTMVAQLRASKDFNTVMHLAAAGASRRDERTLGVRDLMDALMRFDPKSRVLRMIKRYSNDKDFEEPVDPLIEVRATLERYANESRDLRLAIGDLRSSQSGQVSGALAALDDKLRGIERNLNGLHAEQGGERGQLTDRIKALQDGLSAHRHDLRLIADRLQGLNADQNGDRLKSLYDALSAHRGETRLIADRLQSLASDPGGERLKALHDALSAHRNETRMIADRMGAIERMGVAGDTGQLQALIGDRFVALQKALEHQRMDFARIDQSLADRIRGLETRLETRQATTPQPLASQLDSVLQRLASIESKLADTGRQPVTLPPGLDSLGDRLQGLERQIGAQRSEVQAMQAAMQKDLKSLEELFDLIPTGDGSSAPAMSDQQLSALQQTIDNHRTDTQRMEANLQHRHQTFERMLDGKLAGLGALSGLPDRLARLEQAVTAQRSEQASVRGALDSELEHVRRAMLALSNTQATLSSVIDEWRQDNSGNLSVISNRLMALEKLAADANAPLPTERAYAPPPPQAAASAQVSPAQVAAALASNGAPALSVQPVGMGQISPSGGLLDRVDRALAARSSNK